MDNIKKCTSGLAFTLSVILIIPLTFADTNQIKLPQETAKLRESKLPGFILATQKCIICHSVDYISYQPPNMNQKQWTAEVLKMQQTYGAPLSEEQAKSIGAYLAVAYGNAKATDPSVLAASVETKSQPDTGSGSSINVHSLLNENTCFGCHAIDKKIVGPAFRKVASKYQNDPQAQAKLTASIQNGSMGRWGQVPMPAMSNLNNQEAKELAIFVLKQ